MKLMIILNEIVALGTVSKGLVQGLDDLEITGHKVTVQTIPLSSACILGKVRKP